MVNFGRRKKERIECEVTGKKNNGYCLLECDAV